MVSARQRSWSFVLFVLALVLAVFIRTATQPPTLWGLVPIVLYAVLVLLGTDVVLATLAALVAAIVMTGIGPKDLAGLMAESLGAFITVVGLIIMLGGGLGQVTRETGVAEHLVRTIIHRIGVRTRTQVQVGVMITSTILVGALGTLAGANAILAPIVIPIVAAVGFTPPALAAMLHAAELRGCSSARSRLPS
ncbi:MAG: Na+/H+ antiporter NhaC family protein [Armatimonadota bacterium]|nr:Na+/H+ antiporter NhaC family protein [Armatimonadota bacterium]MDR7544680.1 Na+/H+ antiporter NhaC family protein [Armatimonadota bacterium]